jgi:hypothetical protein
VGFAGEMVSVAYNNKIMFAEMGTKKVIVDIDTLICAFNRAGSWLISMEANCD